MFLVLAVSVWVHVFVPFYFTVLFHASWWW